jgi:D-lyxose ketol-isomerase
MMKRSLLNAVHREASLILGLHSWILPPRPAWEISDLNLGDFNSVGFTAVKLIRSNHYHEILHYLRCLQTFPFHRLPEAETLICRWGTLSVNFQCPVPPGLELNGIAQSEPKGNTLILNGGDNLLIPGGLWHSFQAVGTYAIGSRMGSGGELFQHIEFQDPAASLTARIEEDENPFVRMHWEEE